MAAKFVITRDRRTNEYRFVFKTANGEIVAESAGYFAKSSAQNAIKQVRQSAKDAEVVDES